MQSALAEQERVGHRAVVAVSVRIDRDVRRDAVEVLSGRSPLLRDIVLVPAVADDPDVFLALDLVVFDFYLLQHFVNGLASRQLHVVPSLREVR